MQDKVKMMYECKFCEKSFTHESIGCTSLEPKRRWNNRKDANVQLALRCYQQHFSISSTTMKNERTYEDFMESKYYTAFVKFANYVMGVIQIARVEHYIEWLLKNRERVDRWSSDEVYEKYIKEFSQRKC